MDAVDVASDLTRCARSAENDCEHCRIRLRSICAALEVDELRELEAIAQPVHFQPRATIFVEGEDAGAVYTVTSGAVRLYRVFDDGRRQILGFMLPGDFLGLDLPTRYSFSADAIDAVSACRFARRSFAALSARKPHLMTRLHAATTRELTQAQDQMMALGRRTAEERLAWFLMYLRRRGAGDDGSIALPMPRLDIADFLGLTIETVSRTLTRLAREGSIAILADGVRVLDAGRIRRLAAA